jgi:lipid II:glycine glycyltransferase (peptidoglycan interpeptide bridge formation enzyme)
MDNYVYGVKQVNRQDEWDDALLKLPWPHALQSWEWGAFKERWGWRATRFLWEQDGRPVAAAQLLQRRLGRTPFSIIYVPKGPLLPYEDTGLCQAVLDELESLARRRHALFIKIDPDVHLGVGTDDTPPEPITAPVLTTLMQRGWRPSAEQIQFRNTVLIDLTCGEEQLLAQMKPKTRYNVRLAERRGVRVLPGQEKDLCSFYNLYSDTSQRDGFLIRPFAYYQDVWRTFMACEQAHLLLADLDGHPIAGLLLFVFGPTAWYMYGASSDAHRNLMPSYVLQWEAIRLAQQLGCARYDMWGAPDRFDASDRMWGVYRFKVGFGGHTVRGMGAYDFAPSPSLYTFYIAVMPRLLALMRKQHRLHGGNALSFAERHASGILGDTRHTRDTDVAYCI